MINLPDAVDCVLAEVRPLASEGVSLLAALGRATGDDVVASERVPAFDNSAMDGYAVLGSLLAEGVREFRVLVNVPAGTWVEQPITAGAAARIMTGAPLPPGVDTVVPVEATALDGDVMRVLEPVRAGANVRRAGEDIAIGDVLFPRGTPLGPAEIGVLASIGRETVSVARRPKVAILATGSELVEPGSALALGQIRNSNSYAAYGQVVEAGGEPVMMGIAPDDIRETRRLVAAALEYDVVITSGGVSVGDYDFVRRVQDELGVEQRFWGVAVKPGKPMAFGVHDATLVFGVPGNPVAAMVSFELYIRPALLALQGRADLFRPFVRARANEAQPAGGNRVELRRCRLTSRSEGWSFTTTGPQGSGILRSMALADGLAVVAPGRPGGAPGEEYVVIRLEGHTAERPPL